VFWDSSALVPIVLPEARSADLAALLGSDEEATLWWASPVECLSAIHRRHREDRLDTALRDRAFERLRDLLEDVDFVSPTSSLRERAGRLLVGHSLRAADSLQLAAALIWCGERPQGQPFVSLDDRLREAARREGFAVLPR